jgi:hypothetical protein
VGPDQTSQTQRDCLQVSLGQGILANAVQGVLDGAMNSPTGMNYVITQTLAVGREMSLDESLLQQVNAWSMHLVSLLCVSYVYHTERRSVEKLHSLKVHAEESLGHFSNVEMQLFNCNRCRAWLNGCNA